MTFHYFDITPDIDKPENIENIRNQRRKDLKEINGGIIRMDKLEIKGVPIVETFLKMPNEPTGMNYIYSITIPFKDRSYVIKLLAQEAGTTGMREAVLASQIAKEKNIDLPELMKSWNNDLYLTDYKHGNSPNLAEDEKYDEMFPFHPLSLLRNELIPKLIKSIKFDNSVNELEIL